MASPSRYDLPYGGGGGEPPRRKERLADLVPPNSDTTWRRHREQRRAERHEVVRGYRREALLRRRAKLQRLRSDNDDDDYDDHSPSPDRIVTVSDIVDAASRNRRDYRASTSPTVILDSASIVDTGALMWTVDDVIDYDHDSTTDDASEGMDDDDDRHLTNMAVVELEKQSAAIAAALATPSIANDTIVPSGVDYVLVSHGYVVHGAYRP